MHPQLLKFVLDLVEMYGGVPSADSPFAIYREHSKNHRSLGHLGHEDVEVSLGGVKRTHGKVFAVYDGLQLHCTTKIVKYGSSQSESHHRKLRLLIEHSGVYCTLESQVAKTHLTNTSLLQLVGRGAPSSHSYWPAGVNQHYRLEPSVLRVQRRV